MSEFVTSYAAPTNEYMILTPGVFPPRVGDDFLHQATASDIPFIIPLLNSSTFVALDFETQGSDYSSTIPIVGLGLAWDTGSCYLPYALIEHDDMAPLVECLLAHKGLIAHNVYFDGGVAMQNWNQHPQWHMCTYALLYFLANEGYNGSSRGLKNAMTELLGWTDSNEHELDEWLVINGYYIGNRRVNNETEFLRTEYRAGKLRPDKSEMHRVPHSILGKYCALDAEATYLLYTEVLRPVMLRFPDLVEFLELDWMHLIVGHIDQKIAGITMDLPGLVVKRSALQLDIATRTTTILQMPEIQVAVSDIEKGLRAELYTNVPAQFKKDGKVSKNYLNRIERQKQAERREIESYNFNLNSGDQLRYLLYDVLGNKVRMTTESGQPMVGSKAFKHMGTIGKELSERAYSSKELSYIDKYIELTEHRNTIHPSFRMPGTTTGRLSSSEPNMQQIAKTKEMMSLFIARPGKKWVDLDFSALEPVVTTEFSQDPNMLAIYGNGRPANDIYLYVGANVPGMMEAIRATGYDPLNPTKEGLARAKKECKHQRSICKVIVLACSYGAGVKKVMETLENDNVYLNYSEVETIHKGYWEVFAKVKDFSRSLEYQLRRNKNYILNGLGRPMAIPEMFKQDILNRFVQSTGHDILAKYVRILTNNLRAARIDYTPIILDFHDSTCVEVDESVADETVHLFKKSVDQLNDELKGTILLRGTPTCGVNLSDVKEPEN